MKPAPNQKQIEKMMINYYPSKEERLIQCKCLSLGFKVYTVAVRAGNRPPVVLEVNYNNKIINSSEGEFDQKFSCYKVMQVYLKFYEKIKDKL